MTKRRSKNKSLHKVDQLFICDEFLFICLRMGRIWSIGGGGRRKEAQILLKKSPIYGSIYLFIKKWKQKKGSAETKSSHQKHFHFWWILNIFPPKKNECLPVYGFIYLFKKKKKNSKKKKK